jgi:helix-turn-helix protein
MPGVTIPASGRFAITPARAVEDARLGDAASRVLACLGTYADKDGWCWPGTGTLASRLGVTRQAVQRSRRQLAELGYIEVLRQRRKDGGFGSNRYRLLFDRALFMVNTGAETMQHDVAYPMQHDVAGVQHDVASPCNVGAFSPTPPYIAERPNKNVHGRSDDRRDTASQFEKFWQVYPSRGGHSNPKKPAREKFDAAVKRGADPGDLIRGAENYAAFVMRNGIAGQFVKQAVSWLHNESWEQYTAQAEPELPRAGLI